jgi:hypothetical protein
MMADDIFHTRYRHEISNKWLGIREKAQILYIPNLISKRNKTNSKKLFRDINFFFALIKRIINLNSPNIKYDKGDKSDFTTVELKANKPV